MFQDPNSTVILASSKLDLSIGTISTIFFFFEGGKNVHPVFKIYNLVFHLASNSIEGLKTPKT